MLAALLAAAGLAVVSFAIGVPALKLQTRLLASVVFGVGAAVGTELLNQRRRGREAMLWVLSAALAVSFGLAVIMPARKLRRLMQHDLALTAESRREFQWSWSFAYRNADEDLARLCRGDVVPGPFYVFGDPTLLFRAHRAQGASILGWGPEFLDSREWQVLHAELKVRLSPYIVVDEYSASMIRSRYAAMMVLLQSKYDVAFVGASGTWYVRR
jgi:hypothetical protein